MNRYNFTITKRDGSKGRFSLDKIMNAIFKAFESANKPTDLGTVSKILNHLDVKDGTTFDDIQHQVKEVLKIASEYREKLLRQWTLFKQGKPIRIIKIKKTK